MKPNVKMIVYICAIKVFAALSLMQPILVAQEEKNTQQEQSAAENNQTVNNDDNTSLDELMEQWSAIDLKLKAKEVEFNAATTKEERTRISGEFATLTAEADVLINKIEASAMTKNASTPSDKDNLKLLMGVLINHASFDRRDKVIELGKKLLDQGADIKYFQVAAIAPRLNLTGRKSVEEVIKRADEAKADDLPRVRFETDQGEIVLELFENEAPNTVANFISLVEKGFYNSLNFHRVIEGFVAQGGCPKGDGTGDPGYKIACECYKLDARYHFKYSLSMANSGPDTGGSQFFITLRSTPNLDLRHTVFGRVIEGQEILDKFARTMESNNLPIPGAVPTKIIKTEVIRKRDHDYTVKKVGDAESDQNAPPLQPPVGAGEKDSDQKSGSGKSDK